jgi:hypothetical protein
MAWTNFPVPGGQGIGRSAAGNFLRIERNPSLVHTHVVPLYKASPHYGIETACEEQTWSRFPENRENNREFSKPPWFYDNLSCPLFRR